MARHQGLPARIRIGFAPYLSGPLNYDHRIAEYWDRTQARWVLIDPQIDEITRQSNDAMTFDPLDMTFDREFYLAGAVWLRCRAEKANPFDFADAPDDAGFPAIRYCVIQELERLNKIELLGWDDWSHYLLTKPEGELSDEDIKLVDQIAELTLDVDKNFGSLQSLYAAMPDYQQAQTKMSEMGLLSICEPKRNFIS